eukprot:4684737-Pyramimonas_sp.AAC.1
MFRFVGWVDRGLRLRMNCSSLHREVAPAYLDVLVEQVRRGACTIVGPHALLDSIPSKRVLTLAADACLGCPPLSSTSLWRSCGDWTAQA